VLERVPADKLAWKPHDKSMSLGKLALHVAMSPGYITDWAVQDTVTMSGGAPPDRRTQPRFLRPTMRASRRRRATSRRSVTPISARWGNQRPDGATMMAMPKAALVRSIALNHTYHHRGQLSVYLRLLDVPVHPFMVRARTKIPGPLRSKK